MEVFEDSNEQFDTHGKLSQTSTLHVNCMKHDPIDLIYNFMLSKALLNNIYTVSIWCMTSFGIHIASNSAYMLTILDTYSQVTLVSTGGIEIQHIQVPPGQLVL